MGLFGASSLATTLIAAACVAAISFSGGFKLSHDIDQGTIQKLNVSIAVSKANALAEAQKVTEAQAETARQASVAEEASQEALRARATVITREIPRYVTKTVTQRVGCVPYGIVRVLDAAAGGVDPATLVPPAGQPDDACSPVDPATLTGTVADNYAKYHEVAERLTALQTYSAKQVDDFNKGK